jgi:hypothetical protein
LSWLFYSTFSAWILVWSFLILLLAYQDGRQDLQIGAYLWATSFVLLWLSVLLPRISSIEPKTLKPA